MIEDVVTAGGAALGFDLPLRVEPGRVVIGPGRVRLLGDEYALDEYVLELAPADLHRTVTLMLVRSGDGLAVLAQDELADHVMLDDDIAPPALAVVAMLGYEPKALEPVRVQRCVVTPGPPHEPELSALRGAVVPVLRVPPDTEQRAKQRARAREFQARRAKPLRARDLKPDDIQALVVLLGRRFGLVTD